MKKGFITIATGKEEYYRLAYNLLRSYRYFCKEPLPFAILCDRENEYTKEFDDGLVFEKGATNSYLDKLSLAEYLPYGETVFIDADCLAYGDLNQIFTCFEQADDFSCFGRVLPLDDKTGWFEYEYLGELQSQVSYVVGLHGGIYYMRKTEQTKKVFEDARNLVLDYSKFKFKGKFDTPGDEPLIALSMAINHCHPETFRSNMIFCYWEAVDGMDIDITKGLARIREKNINTILLHWGTRFTRELEYKRQCELLDVLEGDNSNQDRNIEQCKRKYDSLIRKEKRKQFLQRVKNKIKRTLKIK